MESRTAQSLKIYTHPECLKHAPGAGHPEAPFRLQAVLDAIADLHLTTQMAIAATPAQLKRAHDTALVDQLFAHSQASALIAIDADTRIGPHSISAARMAAGSGVQAVRDVIAGETKQAFCAVRPPGHHATRDQAMGFCLFNSIAVAAYAALDAGLARVSIIDFDVHHGNGTQDIFWNEPRVQYLSTHQSPLYPGSGREDECGLGNIVNAPLASATDGSSLREAWQTRLKPAIETFAPQLILISAGFDAHALDPLAGLNWHEDDYYWITREIKALAERFCDGKLVSMLEGGYSAAALKACTRAHLSALSDIL